MAALLAALAWTLVIGASLVWNYWHEEEEHRSLAKLETRLGLPHQQIVRQIENDRSLLGGLGATHGAIWLAGLAMIGFIRSRARAQAVTRRDDLRHRRVSEQVFDQTTEGIVITDAERRRIVESSAVAGHYEKALDRESAFEMLKARAGEGTGTPAPRGKEAEAPAEGGGSGGIWGGLSDVLFGSTGPRGGKREGVVDALAKSAARSVGSSIGRSITRGVLGSLLGGKR